MSLTVCIVASTLEMIEAGGHMWVYLNWALGLKALGCRVLWMEQALPGQPGTQELQDRIEALKARIGPFGLADSVVIAPPAGEPSCDGTALDCVPFQAAIEADLVLNIANKVDPDTVGRFRRSALVDIDPGIMQLWAAKNDQDLTRHDFHFSIGETVGSPGAPFPDCGVRWHHIPPPIHLPSWPITPADSAAPYTTVSSWWGWSEVLGGESFNNEKRTSFLELLDLPSRIGAKLELSLSLWKQREHEDVRLLESHGWSVRHAFDVAPTPELYREYLKRSRGEFSAAKPSCKILQNAWISDRTLSYLAMGKPAVVEHTGPSRFLPDADGLLRFQGVEEAARMLAEAESSYERHSRSARAFVEKYFDAEVVIGRVLEIALP